jgi:hypothetical protein
MTIVQSNHKMHRDIMEAELSETDLLTALNTCADSVPMPGGIPDSSYKKIWCIVESFILNSWKQLQHWGVASIAH